MLHLIDETNPELQEKYRVILVNVTKGRFGNNTVAELTAPENDDPYGLFSFNTNGPFDTWIAEDFPPGNESNSTGTFTIKRYFGSLETISVSCN